MKAARSAPLTVCRKVELPYATLITHRIVPAPPFKMPHRFAQRSVHQHRPAATSGAVKGAVRWRAMTKDRSTAAKAGGFLIATGVLLDAVGGVIVGQASAGCLLGVGAGPGVARFLRWSVRATGRGR